MRVVPLIFLTVFLSFCLFAIYTNPKSALALASSVKISLANACGLKQRVSSTLRIYTIRRPSGVRLMFSRLPAITRLVGWRLRPIPSTNINFSPLHKSGDNCPTSQGTSHCHVRFLQYLCTRIRHLSRIAFVVADFAKGFRHAEIKRSIAPPLPIRAKLSGDPD